MSILLQEKNEEAPVLSTLREGKGGAHVRALGVGRAPTVVGHVGIGDLTRIGSCPECQRSNGIAEHKSDTICLEFQMMA